jgi:hypothetical protein
VRPAALRALTAPEQMSVTRPTHHGSARARLSAVLAALVAAASVLLVPLPAAAADPPSFVILLDGLCSELPAGAPYTASFTGADGLAARLEPAAANGGAVVGYSYTGGAVDGAGNWVPAAYGCPDSRDHSLAHAVDALDRQVTAIANAHAGARFHLVGFSLGGAVAFGYLGRLIVDATTLPGSASLASVTTLDAPLGGAPFVELLCGFAPDVCGGRPIPADDSALRDLSLIWMSATGSPAGGKREIVSRLLDPGVAANTTTVVGPPAPISNQAVAAAAAARGTAVLTIGNIRDWLYAPAGPNAGSLSFLDTQWLTTDPRGAGVHARSISAGPGSCPAAKGDLAASFGCNHGLVTRDASVATAISTLIAGRTPAMAATCGGGVGNCLSLPPRPATKVNSVIAANLVSGGGRFVTSAVKVKKGGRATLLFSTSPKAAGRPIEIWGRGKTGSYRYMTTRTADRNGVVRYYTPPITAWAAIQARYAGDYVNGPGVSPGRVVTIR